MPLKLSIKATACSAMIVLASPSAEAADAESAPDWADVAEIFVERCVMCHSKVAGASKGLRLDDYSLAIAGSERGPVLLAGNVLGSELVKRLRGQSSPRMPFLSRPLPEEQITLIERWIEAGLPQ